MKTALESTKKVVHVFIKFKKFNKRLYKIMIFNGVLESLILPWIESGGGVSRTCQEN